MNDDLPAVYDAANRLSLEGQATAKRYVAAELGGLVVGAASGLLSWRVGDSGLDVFGGVGVFAFLLTIVLTLARSSSNPERKWYEGRAGAESAKTLAWRYAVGGDPFPLSLPSLETDQRFLSRLAEIVSTLGDLGLPAVQANQTQITSGLRATRASSLSDRKEEYERARIVDQSTWYGARSRENGRKARWWSNAVILASVVGLFCGFARFVGWLEVDLLGLAAAAAGAGSAWLQLNQHRTLQTSYAVAQQELLIIRDRIEAVADDEWALFVSDAEDAISREHTLWLARRGHPGLRRSGEV